MELVVEALPGGVTLVRAAGRLDIDGAQEVEPELRAFDAGARVVIDLSQVSFLASMGLRVLMVCARDARAKGGRVVLASPGANVAKVLRETGVGDLIGLHPSVEAAVAALAT